MTASLPAPGPLCAAPAETSGGLRTLLGPWATLSAAMAVTSLLQLAAISLLAGALPAQVFGQLAMLFAAARLVCGIAGPNIAPVVVGTAAQHWYSGRKAEFARLFWQLWSLEVFAAACAAVGLTVAAWFLAKGWLPAIEPAAACMAALAPVASATTGFAAWLRMHGHFASVGLRDALVACIRVVIVLIAVRTGLSPSVIVVLWFLAELSGTILLTLRFLAVRRSARLPFPDRFGPFLATGQAKLAYRSHAWSTMRLATLEADTLLVGIVAGDIAAGVVRLAKQLALLVNRVAESIEQVVFPRLVETHACGGWGAVQRLHLAVSRGAGVLAAVILAAWSVVGSAVLGRLFPAAPAELGLVTWVQMLAFTIYLVGVTRFARIMIAHQETQYTSVMVAATSVFFLALALFVARYGAVAAAIAHLCFNLVWYAGTGRLLSRRPPPVADGGRPV